MYSTVTKAVLLLAATTLSAASPQRRATNGYVAASSTDSRAPCPMLNTLANHAYLPHNGKNISMEDLETALSTAINLAPAVTRLVGASAFTVDSTSGYTGTINLADLVQHGIIEHDASISRADTVTGDALTFNEAIWESTFALFTSSTITVAQIAAARQARIAAAATTVNAAGLQGGLLEMAALMRTFQTTGGAGRAWVDVFFREERFPIAEGWTKSSTQIITSELTALAADISAAS